MKMEMKMLLPAALLIAVIAGAVWVSAVRPTVPGTEEVYEGIAADRAMSVVDWLMFDKAPFLAESRPYIGLAFDGGGGDCFWIADVCDEPERAMPGDRVRIETAEEESGLRVVTKITVLEKLNPRHSDPH